MVRVGSLAELRGLRRSLAGLRGPGGRGRQSGGLQDTQVPSKLTGLGLGLGAARLVGYFVPGRPPLKSPELSGLNIATPFYSFSEDNRFNCQCLIVIILAIYKVAVADPKRGFTCIAQCASESYNIANKCKKRYFYEITFTSCNSLKHMKLSEQNDRYAYLRC